MGRGKGRNGGVAYFACKVFEGVEGVVPYVIFICPDIELVYSRREQDEFV